VTRNTPARRAGHGVAMGKKRLTKSTKMLISKEEVMKRFITLIILSAATLGLIWGCESVSGPTTDNAAISKAKTTIIEIPEPLAMDVIGETQDDQSPLMIDTLPNGNIVSFTHLSKDDQHITAAFNYVTPDEIEKSRILVLDESLASLSLFDESGFPISGYSFDVGNGDAAAMSAFSISGGLGISCASDGAVSIEILDGESVSSYEFANRAEFDLASTAYQAVHYENVSREDLSPYEQDLLERMEMLEASIGQFDPLEILDSETAQQVVLSGDFQENIGAGYSDEQGLHAIPEWLRKACTIVYYFEMICDMIGNPEPVCKYVKIAALTCDMIYDVFQ
jgi:hypothetical protein